AFAAIVSGWEAYAQHLRGAFSHWLMWTPVGLTPPTVVAAIAAIFSKRIARHVLPVLSIVSLVDGVVGFVFHLRGIGRMPGGWKLGQYNVVMGPPVFAPLLTCTVGVIGILAALLRRADLHSPTWNERLQLILVDSWQPRPRRASAVGAFAANVARGRF